MKNYTKDNRTQDLVEKSQWNFKNNRNLEIHSRLDDFIINYKEVNRRLIDRFCEISGLEPSTVMLRDIFLNAMIITHL